MRDLAERFATNPLLTPGDVPPSRPGLSVICVLNPGAFTYNDRTWLVLRVAEGLPVGENTVSAIILDPSAASGIRRLEVRGDDSGLQLGDPRGFRYRGQSF